MMTETFDAERQLHFGRAGDRLGLTALLRLDSRIGAGGVDEGQDRQFEAVGEFHQAYRLAVALGPRHAEIVPDSRPVVAPFSWPSTQTASPRKRPKPPTMASSSPKARSPASGEVLDQAGAVIHEMRALRVTGDERLLPGRQRCVEPSGPPPPWLPAAPRRRRSPPRPGFRRAPAAPRPWLPVRRRAFRSRDSRASHRGEKKRQAGLGEAALGKPARRSGADTGDLNAPSQGTVLGAARSAIVRQAGLPPTHLDFACPRALIHQDPCGVGARLIGQGE